MDFTDYAKQLKDPPYGCSTAPIIPYPAQVLNECIEVMRKKADDYQNGNSTVKQADYYPHGIQSLYDMVNTKRLRVKSLMDKMQAGGTANFEGLEDSLKDLINYAAFSVAWLRGQIEGQDTNLDAFNRPKYQTHPTSGLPIHPQPKPFDPAVKGITIEPFDESGDQ